MNPDLTSLRAGEPVPEPVASYLGWRVVAGLSLIHISEPTRPY